MPPTNGRHEQYQGSRPRRKQGEEEEEEEEQS